jgi:hypothetical protein
LRESFSVKAKTEVSILSLKLSNFLEIIKKFNKILKNIVKSETQSSLKDIPKIWELNVLFVKSNILNKILDYSILIKIVKKR